MTKTFRFENSSRIDLPAVDNVIVEYREKGLGATAIALDIGISRSSINKRIAVLLAEKKIAPLVVTTREISKEERAVIAREYADCDTRELSARLGMTMEQLSGAAKTLSVRRSHEALIRQQQAASAGRAANAAAAPKRQRVRAKAKTTIESANDREFSRVPPGFLLNRVTGTGRVYLSAPGLQNREVQVRILLWSANTTTEE